MMKFRLLISILLLSLILPSCNPNKTAAGKAHGSPAKTEGDLLSSRDYEDAPENLSQAPPLQPVIPFQACQA